jgi:hypothetical protein
MMLVDIVPKNLYGEMTSVKLEFAMSFLFIQACDGNLDKSIISA